MTPCVTLPTAATNPPRLTPGEIDALANFAFLVHQHDVTKPARPIFWWRTEADDVERFWN